METITPPEVARLGLLIVFTIVSRKARIDFDVELGSDVELVVLIETECGTSVTIARLTMIHRHPVIRILKP